MQITVCGNLSVLGVVSIRPRRLKVKPILAVIIIQKAEV